MTLKIGPHILAAFERDAEQTERHQFLHWWQMHADSLGAPPPATMVEAVYSQARTDAAEQLGITDNTDDRIFLQAAATRLIPNMSGEQFLLIADLLFDDAPAASRISRLVAISHQVA